MARRAKTKRRSLRKRKGGSRTRHNQSVVVNLTNINEQTVIPESIKTKFHEYFQKFKDEMEYESARTGEVRLLFFYFENVKYWLYDVLNNYRPFSQITNENDLVRQSSISNIMSRSENISWDNITTALLEMYKYMYENRQYKNNFREELFPPIPL